MLPLATSLNSFPSSLPFPCAPGETPLHVCVFVRMVGSRDQHKELGESEEKRKEERVIEGEERFVGAEIYCLR